MAAEKNGPKASTACSRCRERKVRCSGSQPCASCVSHAIQCIYPPSQRRRRNKGSEGQTVIENRLARMEALLQATGVTGLQSSPQQSLSPLDMTSHLRGQGDSTIHVDQSGNAFMNPQVTEPQSALGGQVHRSSMTAMYESPPTTLSTARHDSVRRSLSAAPYTDEPRYPEETAPVDQGESIMSPQKINWEYHGPGSWLSICSEPGVRWVCERTGVTDFIESARDLTQDWTRRLKMKQNLTRTKAPELDIKTAWQYCTAYFEESYDAIFGVIYRPAFEARLRSHFEHYVSVEDDPAWYAIRNTVYAAGCRLVHSRDHATTFSVAQVQAWQYFENALSVLMELQFAPTGLSVVQALTVMTFYVEGLGSPALEYMLCAIAARLAQAKGLHRQPSRSWRLPESEVLQRNWLFWTIYSVEKLIAYRSGRPSAIDDDDISCQVPTSVVVGSAMNLDVLTAYVQHAQISSRISRKLASAKAFQQPPSVLIKTFQELSQQLQHWRDSLPLFLRTERPIRGAELPQHVQVIHVVKIRFLYHGSLIAIHPIFAYPWISAMFGNVQSQALRNQISISSNVIAEAARNLILAVRYISIDAASSQWSAFYYPMVGLINLFIYILKFPALPSAQSDVALLDVITGHFGHMEFVTSSELRFSFAREAAALAHATVRRAKDRPFESPALPSLIDGSLSEMDVDAFKEVTISTRSPSYLYALSQLLSFADTEDLTQADNFDAIDFDMESWNIFSSVTMEGFLND